LQNRDRFLDISQLLAPREGEIPAEVRQALLAGRRQEAAEMLMQKYGLSCDEASDLLDVFACE
jgi:hypothetical protein